MAGYNAAERYKEKKKNNTDTSTPYNAAERYKQHKQYENTDTNSVDKNYINSFLTDASNFLGNAKVEENSYNTWQDLSSRANTIKAWTWKNRDNLEKESYKSLNDSLSAFDSAAEYWNQFKTPEEYNEFWKEYSSYYNKWGKYADAEDYAQNSKYVSTRTDVDINDAFNFFSGMYNTSQLFGDFNYDYINRNPDAGVVASSNNAKTGATALGVSNNFIEEMTDNEIGIYNYLYATQSPEAAKEFLKDIEGDLTRRQRAKSEEYFRNYAKESPIGSSIYSILTSPLKGLSYVGQTADYLDDGKIDQNAGYNKFSYSNSAIRNEVSKDMSSVGSFLYNTGMSMGDFLLNTGITGGNPAASLAIMGTGAAADTVIASKDMGLSDNQAWILGTAAGAIEAATEKIGIDAMLDKKLLGNSVGKYILKNVLAEGMEEGLSNIGNTVVELIDLAFSGDESKIKREIAMIMQEENISESKAVGKYISGLFKQLGLDVLGGALSGGVIGGINAIPQSIYKNKQATQLYGDSTADLVSVVLDLDPNNKYAQKMKTILDSGKKLSGGQINRLLNETNAIIRNSAKAEKTSDDSQTNTTDTDSVEIPSPTLQNTAQQAETTTTAENTTAEENATESEFKASEDVSENETVDDAAVLEEASKKYGTQAQAMIHIYNKGQDVYKYDSAYKTAYDMGKSGVSFSYAKNSKSTAYLTETQKELAYEAGRIAGHTTAKEQDKTNKSLVNGKLGRKKGTVKGEGVTISDLRKSFNDTQNKAYKILSTYSEVTGIDIVLYKSETDEDGNFIGSQGKFKWKEDTIYIEINAGLTNIKDVNDLAKYTMLRTFSHEFAHFIEKWNPIWYNEFRKVVFDTLTERGENVHDLIETKMSMSEEMTYDEASREVVAEAMTDILPDATFVEALATKHKNIFDKLLDKLKEFLKDLKEYFKAIGDNSSREAKALKNEIDGAVHYVENIVKLFDKVALEAVENYQKTVAIEEKTEKIDSTVTNNSENISKSAEKVQNSEKSLFEKYNDIKQKYPNNIVLYRVGDFFEVLGEDAKTVAEWAGLTLTGRNDPNTGRVPMVGFPFHMLEKYVDKVRRHQSVTLVQEENGIIKEYPMAALETPQKKETVSKAEITTSESDSFTITDNTEFGTLEIKFDGKPSEDIRNMLKEYKFRWHKTKGVWYGKADRADILKALREAYQIEFATNNIKEENKNAKIQSEKTTNIKGRTDEDATGRNEQISTEDGNGQGFSERDGELLQESYKLDAGQRGELNQEKQRFPDDAFIVPKEGTIEAEEYAKLAEYGIEGYVVKKSAWDRDVQAFALNGKVYLREGIDEKYRGMVGVHEATHIMKHLEYQPYLDFIDRVSTMLDISSKYTLHLIKQIVEHYNIDLLDMSEIERIKIYDELNAWLYGSYTVGLIVGDTRKKLDDAFYDFDTYIKELSDIHEQFKKEAKTNAENVDNERPILEPDTDGERASRLLDESQIENVRGASSERNSLGDTQQRESETSRNGDRTDTADRVSGSDGNSEVGDLRLNDELTEQENQIKAEQLSETVEKEIEQKQQRTNTLTDREVLEIAAEDLMNEKIKVNGEMVDALSQAEKDALTIFQNRLSKLKDLQAERAEQGRLYKEQQFGEKADRAKAKETLNRMHILDERIKKATAEVLTVEEKEILKRVLKKARKVVETQERQHGQEILKRWRERRDNAVNIKKYKDRILSDREELIKWLKHPLEKNVTKHINDNVKDAVINFLLSIDTTSARKLRNGVETKEDLKHDREAQELFMMLNNLSDEVRYSGDYDLPLNFTSRLETHIKAVQKLTEAYKGEKVLNRMSVEELRDLSIIIANLKTALTTMNKFHANAMFAHVTEAGDNTVSYLKELRNSNGNRFENYVMWKSIRPAEVWKRFGKGGISIERALRKGQDKLGLNAKVIIDFAKDTFTANERKSWDTSAVNVTLSDGRNIKLTVSALMSFYELSKRKHGRAHILNGGVTVADVEIREDKKKQRINGRYGRFTEADIDIMNSKLTDRQKEVADQLQQFMEKRGGEWGNYVTLARFGEKPFGEVGYFPISVDKLSLSTQNNDKDIKGADLYRLLNMGFTKELSPNTEQPLMLYSIFDVFSTHMADMAQYNAMALPVLDAIRWLNYKTFDSDTKAETSNLRAELNRVYGSPIDGKGYAENFIVHILKAYNSSEAHSTPEDALGIKFMHNYNRAQVAFNLRVVVQQPMSITRAALIINPKYITKALNAKKLKANIEDMLEHSGIAVWKDLGYYDINISRGLTQMIKQDKTYLDKITDFGLKPAELMDKATWGVIWYACKLQLADQGITDYKQIEELFDEVIYRTQVVDSVLTKSQYMRDAGFFARASSAFMSESVTVASSVLSAYDDFQTEIRKGSSIGKAFGAHKKAIVKTMLVCSVSAIMLSVVQAVADALRDDDDYEKLYEKFLEAFKSNLIDEFSPLNKLPLFKYIEDVIEVGLDIFTDLDVYGKLSESAIAQWFDTLIKALEITKEQLDGNSNYTLYAMIYKYFQVLSGISGIPASAAMREVVTIWNNTFAALLYPELKVTTYEPSDMSQIRYAYEDGYLTADEAVKEMFSLTSKGYSEENIRSQAKSQIGEWYSNDEISKQQTVNMLDRYFDMESDEIDANISYWDFKNDNPDINVNIGWFEKYYSDISDSGISIDEYVDYRNKVKDITGEDKKSKRMKIINSLPISKSQKDVLYLAEGWSESKLYEAPWH